MSQPAQKPTRPDTPTCDKLAAYGDESRHISQFTEWLLEHTDSETLVFDLNFSKLLMEYLEIDTVTLERERRALLAYQRELNED